MFEAQTAATTTDETSSSFRFEASYPSPTQRERERLARARVEAALEKLKRERALDATPELKLDEHRRLFGRATEEEEDARWKNTTTPKTPNLGPPRRVAVRDDALSPNLISFSPDVAVKASGGVGFVPAERRRSGVPTPSSSLGPPRRVLIDERGSYSSFSRNRTPTMMHRGQTMFVVDSLEERKVYPTPETQRKQARLKKTLLERLARIAAMQNQDEMSFSTARL